MSIPAQNWMDIYFGDDENAEFETVFEAILTDEQLGDHQNLPQIYQFLFRNNRQIYQMK